MLDPNFIATPWIHFLEWMRLPGDAVFIVGGTIPLVILCWRAIRFPNPNRTVADHAPTRLFTVETAAAN